MDEASIKELFGDGAGVGISHELHIAPPEILGDGPILTVPGYDLSLSWECGSCGGGKARFDEMTLEDGTFKLKGLRCLDCAWPQG